MVHFPIELGGIKTWSELYIEPDLGLSMIFGENWLKKSSAQINFCPNQLKLKGVKIPLDINTSGEFNIYSLDSIKLPPCTTLSCTAK